MPTSSGSFRCYTANCIDLCTALHTYAQEDWVLCRVFQKRKGDGDGDGQDNAGAFSPTFAGSSHVMPDHPATTGAYYDLQTGSSAAFAPHQDQEAVGASAVLTNAAMPHYYSGTVLDHHHGFQQEMGGVLPGFGTRGVGDEYGFNSYFDMGFEDMTNLGGTRFPQGWN